MSADFPTDAEREAVAQALADHWRRPHTNESLGKQRMLAGHVLDALAPHIAERERQAVAEALREAATEFHRIIVEQQTTLGMPTDQWLRERAARVAEGGGSE